MKVGALNLKNLTVIARCIIGMLFLYMGIVKALQPTDFLKLIRQYDMVDNYLLLNSMAIIFLGWRCFVVCCSFLESL